VTGEIGDSPEKEFEVGGTVREFRNRLSGKAPADEVEGKEEVIG